MMEKPCTCGGDNPNCYRCFGTGFYTPQDSQSSLRLDHPNHIDSQISNKFKSKSDGLNKKTICYKKSVFKKLLDKDIYKRTYLFILKLYILKFIIDQAQPPRDLYVCQKCGVKVKNIEKHMQKIHGLFTGIFEKEKTTANRFFQCPECNQMVKNLVKHKLKAHVNQSIKKNKNQPSKMALKNKSIKESSNISDLNNNSKNNSHSKKWTSNNNPNMDAKYGWGNSFRDHGQFGSYPLHDDMGDESFE